MEFKSPIRLSGKTATGIVVPAEVVEALSAGKRPKVYVTFNGYAYRSSIAPMDGEYMIPVSEDVRKKAGVTAGETVNVTIELDTEPRAVVVPPELARMLDTDPEAKSAFSKLSYSNQSRIVLPIDQAKTPETRQRRIEKAIEELREKKVEAG